MVKSPEALGLIMCREFKVDPQSHRVSLDGLFTSLRSEVFPTLPMQMTEYSALFDGRGEGEMRLTCTHLEKEEDFFYHSRWCSFPMPGQTVHFPTIVRRMAFPAAGRYAFTLSFDGEPLTTSFVDVRRS